MKMKMMVVMTVSVDVADADTVCDCAFGASGAYISYLVPETV